MRNRVKPILMTVAILLALAACAPAAQPASTRSYPSPNVPAPVALTVDSEATLVSQLAGTTWSFYRSTDDFDGREIRTLTNRSVKTPSASKAAARLVIRCTVGKNLGYLEAYVATNDYLGYDKVLVDYRLDEDTWRFFHYWNVSTRGTAAFANGQDRYEIINHLQSGTSFVIRLYGSSVSTYTFDLARFDVAQQLFGCRYE